MSACECGETHGEPIVYQAGPACAHCGLHPYDGHGYGCPYRTGWGWES